jgi:RNA polymerase sigma-70 factor (ECF subfamily)
LATDGELVRRARCGEASAYDELARRWAARVLAVCHARVGRDAAEDLAQEALLRGLRGLATLADPEKFGPWLVGIAVRTCLDWLKSAQRREVSLDAMAEGDGSSGGSAVVFSAARDEEAREAGERRERSERLMREVEQLPPAYREVLMLYYYQDCTYQELADALGVSAATINARLTKARAMLRSRMMAEQE